MTASNATIARQPNSANISQNNSEKVSAQCRVDIKLPINSKKEEEPDEIVPTQSSERSEI